MQVDFRSRASVVAGTAISVIAGAGNTMKKELSAEPVARIRAGQVSTDVTINIDGGRLKATATEGASEFKRFLIDPIPTEWTSKLEKEFRSLALLEAGEKIEAKDLERLNTLTRWRDIKLNPRSPLEIRQELRESRLLENLRTALEAYVDFKEIKDCQKGEP